MKLTKEQEQLAKEFLDSGNKLLHVNFNIIKTFNGAIYQIRAGSEYNFKIIALITPEQLNWYRDMGDDESIELNQQAIDARQNGCESEEVECKEKDSCIDALICNLEKHIAKKMFENDSVEAMAKKLMGQSVMVSDIKSEWDGNGLPPVGVECHLAFKCGNTLSVKITYMGDGVFAYILIEDFDGRETGKEYVCGTLDLVEFRPLKTPEQVEAEELEKLAHAIFNQREFRKDFNPCSIDSEEWYNLKEHWIDIARAAKKLIEGK